MATSTEPSQGIQMVESGSHADETKLPGTTTVNDPDFKEDSDSDAGKQDGVKQMEAITSAWTKRAMWTTFGLIYIVTFVDSLMQITTAQLTPYVTSAFQQHALLSTTSVLSSIVGGVSALTVAKIINIWGRVEGLALMLVLIDIGLIVKAVCPNVEAYAAAHTIYWVGHLALISIIQVFIADTTSLRSRQIIYGFNMTPSIATVFAGPALAQRFLDQSTWRWAFGAFCIIMPAISLPLLAAFIINHRKAKQLHLAPKRESGRTWWESFVYYVREFDVLGMLLITAGFALILLPFSLASSSAEQWASGHIIAMLVIGVCCLIAFAVWERWFAPVAFLPWQYLMNRTIISACVCYGVLFLSIYTWDIYFSSYLQVVNRQSVQDAGYILNSYSLTSSVAAPFVGFAISYFGRPKYLALAAIPFATLGTALLIHFRTPGGPIGYMVMCQIFNGIAGALIPLTSQIAIMASVGHNEVAVVLALHGLFGSIGSSVGLAISGAIWTSTLPGKLLGYLPQEAKADYLDIYADITVQLSYAWDSPTRDAIVQAYGDVQRLMAIAGAAFMPVLFLSILLWRNLDVRGMKQTKGTVF